jgi:cysteine synthase
MVKPSESILDLMKGTPLVALRGRLRSHPRASLYAKLEYAMPGQMKARVALKIIEDAESSGLLRAGGLIVESSSGTMAEGLACVAAVKGYRLIVVGDSGLDALSAAKLSALGAEVEIVGKPSLVGGWQGARLERLREILEANPGAFWPRQYDNPRIATAYGDVADELIGALGSVGALVGAVGSGASLCGIGHRLLQRGSETRIVAVDAVGSVLFNQPARPRHQKGHGNDIIPSNLSYELIDEVHWINDGEAFAGCAELARREGLFAGGSSGATYVVASWVAEQLSEDKTVVALFADNGDRYANTTYSSKFLADNSIAGLEAVGQPTKIHYGIEIADHWCCSGLPHDGSIAYYNPDVPRSMDIASERGNAAVWRA